MGVERVKEVWESRELLRSCRCQYGGTTPDSGRDLVDDDAGLSVRGACAAPLDSTDSRRISLVAFSCVRCKAGGTVWTTSGGPAEVESCGCGRVAGPADSVSGSIHQMVELRYWVCVYACKSVERDCPASQHKVYSPVRLQDGCYAEDGKVCLRCRDAVWMCLRHQKQFDARIASLMPNTVDAVLSRWPEGGEETMSYRGRGSYQEDN